MAVMFPRDASARFSGAFGPFTKMLPARSVKRTTLEAKVLDTKTDGDDEILTLRLRNTGAMTALFTSVHPLLDYRNDFYLSDNHLSIPRRETDRRARGHRGFGVRRRGR